MSLDTTTDQSFVYQGPMAARMACHLGDRRASVLCNILGDQPLFYIDYVDQEEADMLDPLSLLDGSLLGGSMLNGAAAEYYPENIDLLRRRMARLEGASQHIDGYQRDNAEEAFDAAFTTKAPVSYAIDDITALIGKSGIARSLLDATTARGLKIAFSTQVDSVVYDRDLMTVQINPRLTPELAALQATIALRQAWLHLNGAGIHPLHFAPEEAVLLNRIQQADLACIAVRAAWELNLAGHKAAWSRILTGSSYDLAVGFAREAISDFRALNNGTAAHATFERWFFSGRCKDVDRKLIQQMLADHHGLVFDNPAVSKMVTADIIARTGELPLGKNYLSGMVEVVLSDPLFTEVRDRSNANFLWFIKFERSFRATEDGVEHSLQGVPAVPKGTSSGAIPGTAFQKQGEVNAQQAEIIAFKGRRSAVEGQNAKKNGTSDMATVYYLDHFIALSNR